MATSFDSTLASLGINRTSQSAKSAQAAGSATLNQSDFLKLLTAQLNNQDPFAPVDNTQFVAQLAQFSSLAGVSETNTTLKSIAEKLGATTPSDALAFVGHTVLTEGNTAYGRATGGIAGAVELDDNATAVTVSIQRPNGEVLKTLHLGAAPQGTNAFDWDGKTDSGDDAGQGPFTVVASAEKAGEAVTSRTLVWAPVAAVSLPSRGAAVLTLPGIGQIPTTAVRQIG